MRTSKIVLSLAGILAVLCLGAYIYLVDQQPAEPPRPATVPKGAMWVGGNKGNWIECVPIARSGHFQCEVFGDLSGERLMTGMFVLQRAAGTASPTLRITSFDGETITTTDGTLVPYGVHTFFGAGKDSWTKDFGLPPGAT